jgi:hypothetical protein
MLEMYDPKSDTLPPRDSSELALAVVHDETLRSYVDTLGMAATVLALHPGSPHSRQGYQNAAEQLRNFTESAEARQL